MSQHLSSSTHYQCHGDSAKPSLVFIHGVGLDHTMWQAQVATLVQHYYVITYDLIGHGQSPLAHKDTQLDDMAKQLKQLLDHLNLSQVHLVGFSLGGLIARVFATQYGHYLTSLVIMNSVFNRSPELSTAILSRVAQVDEHGPSANIDQALERWFSPAYTQHNADYIVQLRTKVLNNHLASYSRCYRLFGEGDNAAKNALHLINCPTLVITGELDPGSTPAMSDDLASYIKTAQAVSVPQARHMMPVENAALVNQYLTHFLEQHSPTA